MSNDIKAPTTNMVSLMQDKSNRDHTQNLRLQSIVNYYLADTIIHSFQKQSHPKKRIHFEQENK